jgi:hypothetical protein
LATSFKKTIGLGPQFGELTGLKKLKARKVADFTPYAVARTDQFKKNRKIRSGQPEKKVNSISGLTESWPDQQPDTRFYS